MKQKKSRALAMLLSVLLLLCQPVWAAAAEGPVTATDVVEAADICEHVPLDVQSYEGTANGIGSLYNTLSTRQKAAYNALKNIPWSTISSSRNHQVRVNVSGITGAAISGMSSGGSFVPTGSGVQAYKDIQNDVNAAIGALRYDRPDLLWLDGVVSHLYSFRGYNSTGRYTITDFYFIFSMSYGGQENIYRERMMAEARSIASTASREKDVYSKVKKVHDILAERSSYNYASLNAPTDSIMFRMAHSAYGGMFKDQYDPVCEGYAKAFKVVLNQMDISCVLAVSREHMWNNVKMDDGLWYNVDLTWNDSGDRGGHDYFLVGSGTVVGGSAFSSSHREVDPFNIDRVSGSRYPKKNTAAYKYIGEDYPPLTYPDVPRTDYAYEHIEKVSKLGYFHGDTSGNFNPGKKITRAEFASVVASVLGADTKQYEGMYSFPDVGTGRWYSGVAYWAKESGTMVGTGGKFRPNDHISRQEMCAVLSRALGLQSGSFGGFLDDGDIADWARAGVYACRDAGLVKGAANGKFNPRNNTVRRDAAIVFANYAAMKGIAPKGEQTVPSGGQ